MDKDLSDKKIISSWQANADAWIAAIQGNSIESRRLVTNQAIIDAVLAYKPNRVLDIGCGEGWLARQLSAAGVSVLGFDIVPALIARASKLGGGDFRLLAYEDLSAETINQKFDVLVCNFSLLGKESVEHILAQATDLLAVGGVVIIQTIHPFARARSGHYQEAWLEGSWLGFDASFIDPAPWYFRTLSAWLRLFDDKGLRLEAISEPMNSSTELPASLIMEVSAVRAVI